MIRDTAEEIRELCMKADRKKEDALNLALAVGDLLQDAGEEVVYTRIDDVYDSPAEKARMGNEADADWFLSFHRNSSEQPNQYNGVETLVFDRSGEKAELAGEKSTGTWQSWDFGISESRSAQT